MFICKLILLSLLCLCSGSEFPFIVRTSHAYLDSDGKEGRAQHRQAAESLVFPPAFKLRTAPRNTAPLCVLHRNTALLITGRVANKAFLKWQTNGDHRKQNKLKKKRIRYKKASCNNEYWGFV